MALVSLLAFTEVDSNVMLLFPSSPTMFLTMSFLSLSDTGFAPPVAATTSSERGSMVALTWLCPGSGSTVTVAFQFDASRVRSCPTFDAIPCRPVRTCNFPSEGPRS